MTSVTTLSTLDVLYKKESTINMDNLCNEYNNSTKIKLLFLRYKDESSWKCDTDNLWGPDTESEYIVDILTKDGYYDNIEFLSVPYNFDISKIKKIDILAYSSNIYSVDYILNIINKLQPTVLLHLSDEWINRPEYNQVFNKVKLVYRQYKPDNENISNVKYLPLGYHSWGKNYIRNIKNIIPVNDRKNIWCFSGSNKGDRGVMLEQLSDIKPFFNQSTQAFESTDMFNNSKFAFCPPGNFNIECYRIYEAMYNGSIPIVVGNEQQIMKFKSTFEIPLPCYFVENIQQMKDIINKTSEQELIIVQRNCIDWCYNISDIIRNNIISSINTNSYNIEHFSNSNSNSNSQCTLVNNYILILILFILLIIINYYYSGDYFK